MTHMDAEDELSQQVRTLLDSILRQADFPGSDELIEQAATAVVEGGLVTMLGLRSSPTSRLLPSPMAPFRSPST